jgi:hypothetical protein
MRMRSYLLFPAITMSLGWGLRGSIGGGPFGAMIPGALVALALCLLLGHDEKDVGLVAAFGAVGIGFGGEMTYGQTVGAILKPSAYSWGLTGLTLKGAIWGLLGGAILGIALSPQRPSRKKLSIALGLLAAGTWIGWRLINEPKLIYFSDRINKPRAEIWAGFLVGTLFLLAYLLKEGIGKVPLRFALWGALGGGIGFGGGGSIFALAQILHFGPKGYSWWKTMELTFGFFFGLVLGWCSWQLRREIQGPSTAAQTEPRGTTKPWLPLLVIVALIGFVVWLDAHDFVRFPYLLAGSGLLLAAFCWREHAWHIAITITFAAFILDLTHGYVAQNMGPASFSWIFAVISIVSGLYFIQRRQLDGKPIVEWSFLFLLWTSVIIGMFKVTIPNTTGIIFLAMGIVVTWIYGVVFGQALWSR